LVDSKELGKVAAIIGVISFFLPWINDTSKLFGVTTTNQVTLISIMDLSSNFIGRMFVGELSNAVFLFAIGTIILWFHKYGSFIQITGFLYVSYLFMSEFGVTSFNDLNTVFSGNKTIGFGYFVGLFSFLIGIYSLTIRSYSHRWR
jgi:hypothetical protein